MPGFFLSKQGKLIENTPKLITAVTTILIALDLTSAIPTKINESPSVDSNTVL